MDNKLNNLFSDMYKTPYDEDRKLSIDMIVVHTTHESEKNFSKTSFFDDLKVFFDKKNKLSHKELSPHYFIADNDILMFYKNYSSIFVLAEPERKTHHAGKSEWKGMQNLNENSIGIEIRGYTDQDLPDYQYESINLLINHLVEKYDIPLNRVVGHHEIAPERKSDPGDKIMEQIRKDQAKMLFKNSFIFDTHQNCNMFPCFDVPDEKNIAEHDMKSAFFYFYRASEDNAKSSSERLTKMLEYYNLVCNIKGIKHVTSTKDLGKYSKELGLIMSMRGADGIYKKNNIESLYEKGVRCLSLTMIKENQYAAGSLSGPRKGLKKKGKELIKKMEDLGIILDVSYLNKKSFFDVMKIVEKPVIASNYMRKGDDSMNMDDEQIRAIAETNGVIAVDFWKEIVGLEDDYSKFIKDINYVVGLTSIDNVAIGSNFDTVYGGYSKKINDVYKTLEILTGELIKEGYTNNGIKKILGLNQLRVFKEICG